MSVRKTIILLFFILIVLAAIRPVSVAGSSFRLLNAFDMDEALHLNIVRQVLNTGSWLLEFSNYGHLYFNLCLLILYPLHFVFPVSDLLIVVILRTIPLLAALCILVFTYRLACRYWKTETALLSVILLALIPPHFFRFAVMSHPDLLQSLFLLLAVFSLIRFFEGDFNSFWLTALFSGLAFASKYGGIFMLALTFVCIPLFLFRNPDNFQTPRWLSLETKVPRALWLGFSLVLTAIGLLLSPERAAGVLATDGQINNPVLLKMIPVMRFPVYIAGAGMLLLGILEIMLPRRFHLIHTIKRVNVWIRLMITASAVFFLTFLITSPASFVGFNFISGILYEARHTATGHIFIEHPSPWIWLGYLADARFYFGRPLLTVLLIGFAVRLVHLIRNKKARTLSAENVLWIWVLFYLIFLMFRVQMARPRYLLTILPCLSILISIYLVRGYHWIRNRLPSDPLKKTWTALAILLIALQIASGMRQIKHRYMTLIVWEDISAAVQAGRWLERQVPNDAVILADQFSYVPPDFHNIQVSYYADESLLHRVNPDYVITNIRVTYAYEDSTRAQNHRNGAEYFMTRYHYYQGLRNGALGYELVKDFDTVRIYRKLTEEERNLHDR